MRGTLFGALGVLLMTAMPAALPIVASADEVVSELEGIVQVASYDLPESAFLSDESRSAMKYFRDVYLRELITFANDCGDLSSIDGDLVKAREIRDCVSTQYFGTNIYKDTLKKHPVKISSEDIAGVYTEIFVPERVHSFPTRRSPI